MPGIPFQPRRPGSAGPPLPERGRAAEDTFVAALADSGDVEALIDRIGEALEARRPQLAARLVGLLPEDLDPEPGSPLEAARRAARFLLLDPGAERARGWSELEDAWAELRQKRMSRIKRRMRRALHGRTGRTSRLDRSRNRRR